MRVGAAIAALVAGAAAFQPSVVRRPAPALRLRAEEPTPSIPRLEDWREVRYRLSRQDAELTAKQKVYAMDGRWAHPIAAVEPGCLLVADPLLMCDTFWQSVIVVLEHGADGTIGLVLNRPYGATMGALAGKEEGPMGEIGRCFKESVVYMGGPVAPDGLLLLHGVDGCKGSRQVAPGIYCGGELDLKRRLQAGEVDGAATSVRWCLGHAGWEAGQLEQEIREGSWTLAAASPAVSLAQCIALPTPLWVQVREMMGIDAGAAGAADIE